MKRLLLLCAASVALLPSVRGLTIVLDYTYDTSGFFTTHTVAKTTLEQAAADISSHISTSLGAIPSGAMSFSGTSSSTTASVDWDLSFTNPSTGTTTSLTDFAAGAGEFRIFVGARSLLGTTLGQGGPVGASANLGGGGSPSQWAAAVAAMNAASDAVMSRQFGPVVGSFSGNLDLGGSSPSYNLSFGLLAGSLWFDNDFNNDSAADSDLSGYWHFDGSTPVGAGLNDFYSVALHEMVHALGLGASVTWDTEHSGANWLGTEGISANGGSGIGLVDPTSLAHIAAGTLSTSVVDDAVQEALMDPTLTTGTRKYLTTLDLAFLQDLGFTLTAVPEPSTYALCAGFGALALASRRRRQS